MSSSTALDSGTSIKRRLQSSGQAFAEHTLETVKNAAIGLQHTHGAYLYPLQVSHHQPFWGVFSRRLPYYPPTFRTNTLSFLFQFEVLWLMS